MKNFIVQSLFNYVWFCVLLYYLHFVLYCTHARMSYVLNSYLLTYLDITGYKWNKISVILQTSRSTMVLAAAARVPSAFCCFNIYTVFSLAPHTHTQDLYVPASAEISSQTRAAKCENGNNWDRLPRSHAITAELHFVVEITQRISAAVFQPVYDQLQQHNSITEYQRRHQQRHQSTNKPQSDYHENYN